MHLSVNSDVVCDFVDYNFSHRIINFSFGEPVAGIVNPLEGEEKLTSDCTFHHRTSL